MSTLTPGGRIVLGAVGVVLLAIGFLGGWFVRGRRPTPAAALTGAEIIRRAIAAERETAYEGRQRLELPRLHGDGLRVLEAAVVAAPGGRQRIQYLTAPLKGVTIWYDRGAAYRYNPARDRLTVATRRAQPSDFTAEEQQLLSNYSATLVGADTRAGRPVWIVDLRPLREPGPWRRLWIDQQRWLVLASTQFDAHDKKRQAKEFLAIRFRSAADTEPVLFRPPADLLRHAVAIRPSDEFTVPKLREIVEFRLRTPTYLPPGFSLDGAYLHPCGEAQLLGARLEYGDGVKRVTLIECPDGGSLPTTPASAFVGGDTVCSRAVDGLKITATGEVSRQELERLLASIPSGH